MFFKNKRQDIQIVSSPRFGLTTLRNMANFMATIDPLLGVKFFEHFKVSPTKHPAHNKLSDKIFNELKMLALSKNLTNRAMLEELIVEAANPALYQTVSISRTEIIEKFNDWLKDADLVFVDFNNSIHLIRKGFIANDDFMGMDHESLEKKFALSIKSNQKLLVRIAEIQYAYKSLMEIIYILQKHEKSLRGTGLNSFYVELIKIIEHDIEYVHKNTKDVFDDYDSGQQLPFWFIYKSHLSSRMTGNFTQPFIYRDRQEKDILYKPFLNLYSAPSEMEAKDENWESVLKHMDACYAMFEDRFYRFGANKIEDYPNKEYLNKVENELKSNNIQVSDNKGSLTFYINSGRIVFISPSGNTYEAKLRKGSNGYLLLQYLIPSSRVIPYLELSKHLNTKNMNIDSDDERRVRDAIQSVRKALKLKKGDDLFVTEYGFGLSCTSIIQKD